MKKLLCVLLCLVLAGSALASCGKGGGKDNGKTDGASGAAVTADTADEAMDAKIAALNQGDTVSYGTTSLRDTSKGPVEVTWKVLEVTDDAVLLFAEQLMGSYLFAPAKTRA